MTEFLMNCPVCGQKMTVQEAWIGMQVACPFCKQTIIVSRENLQPSAASMQTPDPASYSTVQDPEPAPSAPQEQFSVSPEGTETDERNWLGSLDLDKIGQRLKLSFFGYIIFNFLAIIGVFLGILASVFLGFISKALTESDNGSGIAYGILMVVLGGGLLLFIVVYILGTVSFYIHHYYAWQLLRPWQRPAGPLATVLFLLIPLFNLYWMFQSVGYQGILLESELGEEAKPTRLFAQGFSIVNALRFFNLFLQLLAMIPIIGVLFSVLAFIINTAYFVIAIIWFILSHKSIMRLLDVRRQAQAAL